MRAFLTNYRRDTDGPANLNSLEGKPFASDRELFDEEVGVETSDMTLAEIDRLRPPVYRRIARKLKGVVFCKIHDARVNQAGQLLIPPDVTQDVLYIVRNPLDVAVSLAHHSQFTLDQTIRAMADRGFALVEGHRRLCPQLPQVLLSWSAHVESWLDVLGLRVRVVRYEDMIQDPIATFGEVVNFSGLVYDRDRLLRAIEWSSFEILKEQERDHGFGEKPPTAGCFFRAGKSGQWRQHLTPGQVQRIIDDHAGVMRRLGYLNEAGQPVENTV